jgi:hypothetical protein
MSDYRCIKCESLSTDESILKCPVYGKICPICGSSEISVLKPSETIKNPEFDYNVI